MKSASSKATFKLLDSDSETEGTKKEDLTFNKDYAERYEKWRGKEELQKMKDRYGEDLVYESSESDSTSEEEWTPDHEKSFLTALSSLKGKDPKIYDGSRKFFDAPEGKGNFAPKTPKKDVEKPFLIKDHERKMILENKGKSDESDNEVEPPHSPSYYEQQRELKTDLKKALKGIESDGEEDNSDLFKKRIKTETELQREEEDYRKWLKGELNRLDETGQEKDLKFLRDYWNDPKLDNGEQFLRDYVLQRKYLEDEEGKDYIPSYDEIVHDSDEGGLSGDEKELEKMETFENKFNFRFEEPDPEFIKKYPRTIEESYRRKETKRKQERMKAKERKEEEKERKIAEIQQLKAFKRKEILKKIEKLQEVAGEANLSFGDIDLEGDFDPEEHDRRMRSIFNPEYYQEADDTKPIFPYDEEIDGDEEDVEYWVPREDEEEEDVSDDQSGPHVKIERQKKGGDSEDSEQKLKNIEKESSKPNVKSELIEASKGRRKGNKKSLFLEALEKKKPRFDPKKHKSFEKYFEEYYKLDFEDLVGDLPCRFKYRTVVPNDFGLTTDEILKADDKELNHWASLKKTYQYRSMEEEKYDVHAYSQKASNSKKKSKVLGSVYEQRNPSDEEAGSSNVVSTESGAEPALPVKPKKKKKKSKKSTTSNEEIVVEQGPPIQETSPKRKRRHKKKRTGAATLNTSATSSINDSVVEGITNSQATRGRKNKVSTPFPSKKNELNGVKRKIGAESISSDRLRAYGINPTKYEKRKKYGI